MILHQAQLNAQGQRLVWLETAIVDKLTALRGPRGPGESYSDVILRLVEIEARGATNERAYGCAFDRIVTDVTSGPLGTC
jgi:hypothetical protein